MSTIQATWTRLASQFEPLQRSSHCLSVIGDKAYVFGGELEPRKPRDNVVYSITLNANGGSGNNSIVNTISAIVNAPHARVGAASTAIGERLYYFGGRGGASMTCLESKGSFDVFDVSSQSWSVVTPTYSDSLPEDRSYHSMTSDSGNTIYLHAGCPAKGRLNDLWAFDIPTSTWTQLVSAPGGGRGGTSIAFSSGKLYRINGFDGKEEQGGTIDVFDAKDRKWSSVDYKSDGVEGPEPRSVAVLVPVKTSFGRDLLVTLFGEGSPSDLGHAGAGRMFSDVWVFDVSPKQWHRVEFKDGEPAPAPRGWFDADVWAAGDGQGDRVVVHGGLHDDNKRLDDVWVLNFT